MKRQNRKKRNKIKARLSLLLSALLLQFCLLSPVAVMATQSLDPDSQEDSGQEPTEQEKKQPEQSEESDEKQKEEQSIANKTISEIFEDQETGQEQSASEGEALQMEQEEQKAESVETNDIPRWPQGPAVSAEGAVLIDADTGTVLYGKNMHERLYPASTTKILTTLIASEKCQLSETVKFSKDAVNSIERASSNMGIDIGQELTMEQCLYGILVYSANEVANAVAEHVSGSIDDFVDLMNQRAAELGCLDSHFVTTNGLHNDQHYTTPYDLAQIGRAFFANETLAKISGTNYYHIPPGPKQPDDIELYTHNQLTKGKYKYEGYVGGKTGYTTVARQTLVTCAERGGMRLICVVMREEAPNQYLDTMTLFDYGFDNFSKVNVAKNENRYTIRDAEFFENDALGTNQSLMEVDPNASIILPNTIGFEDLDAFMSNTEDENNPLTIATIDYTYENQSLGSASVVLSNTAKSFDFYDPTGRGSGHKEQIVFVNIRKTALRFLAILSAAILISLIAGSIRFYHFSRKNRGSRQNVNFRKNERRRERRRRRTAKSTWVKNQNRTFGNTANQDLNRRNRNRRNRT